MNISSPTLRILLTSLVLSKKCKSRMWLCWQKYLSQESSRIGKALRLQVWLLLIGVVGLCAPRESFLADLLLRSRQQYTNSLARDHGVMEGREKDLMASECRI